MEYLERDKLLLEWKKIVDGNQAHASIRVGDGEACIAAHDEILTMNFVRKCYSWSEDNSRGITLPNNQAREYLVEALRQADYIGVLDKRWWGFRPLTEMIMDYYKIYPAKLFYAFDNYHLSKEPAFYETFKGTMMILVGEKSENLRSVLEKRFSFSNIVGTVTCSGFKDLHKAKQEMDQYNYRLALVSAGVPGKSLIAHAKLTGHVGIDFGSGADTCIQADQDGFYPWEWTGYPKYF